MRCVRPSWSRIGGVLVTIALATSSFSPTLAYAASAIDKSETVHVQTDAGGTVSSVTVEDLLANDAKSDQLQDKSNLTDINAADEKQTFAQDADGTITWQANGEQVSYKGASSKQPPVEVKVTYTLDGKPVRPSELAGASGHLAIRIDYQNNAVQDRAVGSSQRSVCTPFVCMTVAMLDSDIFSHVTVKNGKVIDDKGGLAVVGYALPGLKESLDLKTQDIDLDLPEFMQIEADVTNLALDPIYTIATPELFTDLDTSDFDLGPDDLGEGTEALSDAMKQLIDGSALISDAVHQLADGSGKIGSGVAEFKEKIAALPSGVQALATGASDLKSALGQAQTTADTLAQAAGGLASIDDSDTGIDEARDAIGAADGSVSDLHDAAGTLLSDAAAAAKEAHDAAQATHDGLETAKAPVSEDLDAASDAIETLKGIDTAEWTDEQKAALAAAEEAIAKAHDDLTGIALPQESLDALSTAASTLESTDTGDVANAAQAAHDRLGEASAALDGASSAIAGVAGTAQQLQGGIKALSLGLGGATSGAAALAEGLSVLSTTAPQVVEGVGALDAGIAQLTDALRATGEGTDALQEGLSTFNDEGITKIIDGLNELDDSFGDLSDNLDALRDTANDYDTFSGKLDGQTGSVRFIYKTERIG